MTDSVTLSGVSKRFGRLEAVCGIDLAIPEGECLALVGHNGAGKTTLMKLVLGLLRPSGGDVRVLGLAPTARHAADMRRQLGYLPENVAFKPAMTGREALRFFARLKGAPAAQCADLLDTVGLADAADRRIGTYSKGMRQRLGLAQALLGAPRLLLLDEPTTGLDPALRGQFYGILNDLHAAGTTVVLSSHALTEMEARTDRVAIMNAGTLVACATLAELRQATALPIRVKVAVQPGRARDVAAQLGASDYVNDRAVHLSCAASGKLALLRRIAALGPDVVDVDLAPPTLEEIYAHYHGRGEL